MRYIVLLLSTLLAHSSAYAMLKRYDMHTITFYRYGTGIRHTGRDGYGRFHCSS